MDTIVVRKLSKEENKVPFYHQLKTDLKKRVAANEFTVGSRMLSEHQLMAEYHVSRLTVVRAISELTKEGVLYRIQGKGTFVAKPVPKITGKEIVGLIMPATGHLFGPLANGIMQGLTEHQYFCLVVDPSSINDNKQQYEKIKDLLGRSPEVLVVEGKSNFPFDLLDQYQGRVIFIDNYEAEKDYPSTRILSDYHEGGRLATEHFIRNGYKKVFFYTYPILPDHKSQLSVIAGARQAFRDHNLPEDNFMIFLEPSDEETLDEALKNFEKPMAIFCHGDHKALSIYSAARRLKLQIPRDISIIGYYNTPWCEVFSPTLSSISIQEQEMAEQVVESILTGSDRKVLLKPKLILRESVLPLPHRENL